MLVKMDPFILATLILIIVYVLIAIEKIPKAVTALLGASLIVILKILDMHEAFKYIDFNVIFLLTSMMIIVNITKSTGVFHWLAIALSKIARGKPMAIMIIFSIVTAVLSAFIDNVTTVLLITPITIVIAKELELSPIPYFICEILSSNIGGTATLIGDPPNIMIGSAAKYDFLRFMVVLGPVSIIIFIVFMVIMYFIYRKKLVIPEDRENRITTLDNSQTITDKKLLIISLITLFFVILGFIFHGSLGFEASTISLAGASFLLIFSHSKKIYEQVEWSTIFFFTGLFIVVGGVVKVGVIEFLGKQALIATSGDPQLTTILILWISGFLSAFIDNIPYTATMIPLISELGTHMNIEPLWWALALGACLGGNGTLIGASANVIISDISSDEGFPITFLSYLKYGMLIMIISLLISTVYLMVLYF